MNATCPAAPSAISAPRRRTGWHLVAVLTLVLISVGLNPASSTAAGSPTGAAAAPWPAAFDSYTTTDGKAIGDTNSDISPAYNDLASGACSGCVGPDASVALASDGTNAFFRMRLASDIADPTNGGLVNGAFLTQIAVDGDVKAVVGVNGTDSVSDYVYVADSAGGVVTKVYTFPFDASGGQSSAGMRVVNTNDGTGQAFLDFQVPIGALTAVSGGAIKADTPVQLYYGSSAAANLATINQDFMLGTATTVNFSTLSTVTLAPLTTTFDVTGGTGGPPAQTVKYNQTLTAPADPTKAGYVFTGWFTAATGSLWNFGTDTVTGNQTLYARWAVARTVIFNANGGTLDQSQIFQTVPSGALATEPNPAPTRGADYAFTGWYTAPTGGTKWDFATSPVNANMTLNAQWLKTGSTLTFNSNGGTPVPAQTVLNGEHPVKPADPTKPGERFYGWSTAINGGGFYDFSSAYVPYDMTLYAFWDYKVTYDSTGGTPVPGDFVSPDDPTVAPVSPTMPGYTFKAWYTMSGSKYVFGAVLHGDLALWALWAKNPQITFDSGGGTPVPVQDVPSGSTVTRPADPTKTGYTFAGWYTSATGGGQWNFTGIPGRDTTLYAHWTVASYTVHFDSNNGTGDSVNATVTYDNLVTDPGTVWFLPGATLSGWNTAADGSGTDWDFATDRVTGNVTLYAQWTQTVYWVGFQLGGTTVNGMTVPEGGFATWNMDDPGWPGYTFLGWNTAADGSGTNWDLDTDPVTADMILYAQMQLNSYTVTFKTGAGSPVTAATVTIYDSLLAPAAPTRPGYTFTGWTSDSAGLVPWDFATDVVTADTTLYAQWAAVPVISHVVHFDSDGGTTVADQTVTDGDLLIEPVDPTRAGHRFRGWYTTAGVRWHFATDAVHADRVLVAHWASVKDHEDTPTDGGAHSDLPNTGVDFPVGVPVLGGLLVLLGSALLRRRSVGR